jgi:hypothetical protein
MALFQVLEFLKHGPGGAGDGIDDDEDDVAKSIGVSAAALAVSPFFFFEPLSPRIE